MEERVYERGYSLRGGVSDRRGGEHGSRHGAAAVAEVHFLTHKHEAARVNWK